MTEKAYVINIDVTLRDGGFFTLDSCDLPGLCLLGKDPTRLIKQVPELVRKLFKLNFGQEVRVIPATKPAFSQPAQQDLGQSKTWTVIQEVPA